MPQPYKVDRPMETHVSIPTSVLSEVRLLLWSTTEDRVPHGALSKLVTNLLAEWVREQKG